MNSVYNTYIQTNKRNTIYNWPYNHYSMSFISTDGCSLYYEASGDGPAVAFLHDVGYGAWMWGWQHASLRGPFEIVVFDPRGTGHSDSPRRPESYTIDTLAADAEAVLADHGVRRVHLVGAGLGGMVALAYAREYNRARSLTLIGTALDGDAVDDAVLDVMGGMGPESLEPCFTDAFIENAEIIEGIFDWRREEDADSEARNAQAAAIQGFACDAPYEITVPALVLHGTDDPLVPLEKGEELANALPNGRFEALDGRHLAFIESSKPANDAIIGFLESVEDS
jgi:3-oxoadipate enol-lactonase